MTNRDWLNNMSQIDRFNLLIKATHYCPLYLIGEEVECRERCERYRDKRDNGGFDFTCYACIAAWLNEEHKGRRNNET